MELDQNLSIWSWTRQLAPCDDLGEGGFGRGAYPVLDLAVADRVVKAVA